MVNPNMHISGQLLDVLNDFLCYLGTRDFGNCDF